MTPSETANSAAQPAVGRQNRWRRLGVVGAMLCTLPLTAWAAAALYFDLRASGPHALPAAVYVIGTVAIWIWAKPWWLAASLSLGAFGLVLAWWLSLQPSNIRNWQPDVAALAYADRQGNQVTLHNVRHCDYHSETEYDVRYYDRSYDLDRLRTLDVFMVYWGSRNMAHTLLSFGFEGNNYVCFSIETRKEKGESYSAVRGLFRQFELIYVVADERDLVGLRTNYRQGEDAYLFRLKCAPEQARALFLDYLHRLNALKEEPEWYNAVWQNCTTSIRAQRAAGERAPWDWRMLVNGHLDELLYERGAIATNLPLAELRQRGHVNLRAQAAGKAEDFSQRIRQGVPGMEL